MPTTSAARNSMSHTQIDIFHAFFLISVLSLGFNDCTLLPVVVYTVYAYHRQPCTRSIRKQFQFPDCYVPSMEHDSLLLSQASFVLSHDAATGYLSDRSVTAVANSYSKNQIGSVYQQLNDGARALDIRPKLLANGTVVFHHGVIVIPVTLQQLVLDAIHWCNENPQELVLILHHDLAYPTVVTTTTGNDDDPSATTTTTTTSITPSADVAVTALSQIYQNLGVTYVQCSDLSGLTVGETMELAALVGGGYLLAMDQHDAYASSCAKQNYVQDMLVTCYSNRSATTDGSTSSSSVPCTNSHSYHLQQLKDYVMASANNEPTDDNQQLGPPLSTYQYPFNEIQALWQVDTTSAAMGLAHVSTLIDDNTKSQLNAHVVEWVYQASFDSVSLLAMDHVQLNGNALLSVLRNQCGQSVLSSDSNNRDNYEENYDHLNQDMDDETLPCGTSLSKPKLQSKPLSTISFFSTVMVFAAFGVWMVILLEHHRRYYQNNRAQLQALDREVLEAAQQLGCGRIDRTNEDSFVLV
jgi:hypothetical protein